jgi:hypothetical protein
MSDSIECVVEIQSEDSLVQSMAAMLLLLSSLENSGGQDELQ